MWYDELFDCSLVLMNSNTDTIARNRLITQKQLNYMYANQNVDTRPYKTDLC